MALSSVALDQRRADMIRALYVNSGRTCGTYTGLWQEFALDAAKHIRDLDADELRDKCVAAIHASQSHLPEHHAEVCIAVIRAELLKGWE